MKVYQYDVALSFAGEDRSFAKAICVALKREGIKVFYDKDEDVNLWGKDLATRLKEVYCDDSQYCIIILSDSYVNKKWPRLELQHAIRRSIEQKGEDYILPVCLDGFSNEVPGMPTIGYIPVESTNPKKVVNKFLQKIRGPHQSQQKKLPPVLQEHGPEEISRRLSRCGSLMGAIKQKEEISRRLSRYGSLMGAIKQKEEISRRLSQREQLLEEISKRFL